MDEESAIVDESLQDSTSSGSNVASNKDISLNTSANNQSKTNTQSKSRRKQKTKGDTKTKVKHSKRSASNTSETKTQLNNMKKCCVKIKKEDLEKLKALFLQREHSKTLKKELEVEVQKEESQDLTSKEEEVKPENNENIKKDKSPDKKSSPTNKRAQSKSPIFIRFPISSKKKIMRSEKFSNKNKNLHAGGKCDKKFGRSFLREKFGGKFFLCYVSVKRITHPGLEPYQKERKNNRKTVSFVETVEVFSYYSPNGKVMNVSQSSSSSSEDEHKTENKNANMKELPSHEMGNTSTPLKRGRRTRALSHSERKYDEEESDIKIKRSRRSCTRANLNDTNQTYEIDLVSDDDDSDEMSTKRKQQSEEKEKSTEEKLKNGSEIPPATMENFETSNTEKEDTSTKNRGKKRKSIDENKLDKELISPEKHEMKQNENVEVSPEKRKPVERIIEVEILDDDDDGTTSAQNNQKSPQKVDSSEEKQSVTNTNTLSDENKPPLSLSSEKSEEMNVSRDHIDLTPTKIIEEKAQSQNSSFDREFSILSPSKRSDRRLSHNSNASTSTNGSKANDFVKSSKIPTPEDEESEREDNVDNDLLIGVRSQSPTNIHGRKSYRTDKSPITVVSLPEEKEQNEIHTCELSQEIQNKIFHEGTPPKESPKNKEFNIQPPMESFEVQEEITIESNSSEESTEKEQENNRDVGKNNLTEKDARDDGVDNFEDEGIRLLRKLREDIINEDVILTDDEDENHEENNDKNKSNILPDATTATPFDDDSDDSLLQSLNKISAGGVENSIKSASETIDLFEVVKRSEVPKETRLIGSAINRNSILNQLMKSNESLEYDDNVLKNDPNMSAAAVSFNDKNDDFSDADEFMAEVQEENLNDHDDVVESLQFSGTNDNDDIINQVEVDLDQSLQENIRSNNKNDKNDGTKFTLNKLLKIFN